MGIACSRILTFAIPIVLGSEILVGCGFSGRRDHSYRFQVANRRLYAIETGSSYGAEGPVYTTDYVGNTWRQIEFPANTYLLSGNGTDLFALTSDGTVWRGSQEGKPWTSVISLDGKYHYSILADNGGGFLVGGLNELTWHDKDGKLLRRFTFDPGSKGDVLFASAHFLGDDGDHVIVEANPELVFTVDLKQGTLTSWSEGLPAVPDNVRGLGHVRRFGSGFLLGRGDGVYQADGFGQPWRRLTTEFRMTDALDTELCRDLVEYDAKAQQWLIATNAGIHLMERSEVARTAFVDTTSNHATADDHDLILQMVPFRDYYFISFVRLKNNAMGVRLDHDLEHWKTIRCVETR